MCTLNPTDQSRVTLSLLQERLRAACRHKQEEKGPESASKTKHDDSRSCLHRLMCANRNEEPEDYESEIEWAIGPSTPSSLQETEKTKQNTFPGTCSGVPRVCFERLCSRVC